MTKLLQWLSLIALYLALWLAFVTDYVPAEGAVRQVVLVSPIFLLVTFACYSVAVIGYRVATFNDCAEAAKELLKEINEAKDDLKRKGIIIGEPENDDPLAKSDAS